MSERQPFPVERIPAEAAGAIEIVRKLRDAGHEALLAGGCVRDLLLGATPKDYDIATDAPPERVCALFRPTRKVGAAFGVVLVHRAARWIEVATFRTDGEYLDGRRPNSVTFSDARSDAQRRDFTVNGMFLDPIGGQVIDYVDGRRDLAARLIRCIGEPATRFSEDYLRLLRAVRFAARMAFVVESATARAIVAHAESLRHVAPERVLDELQRMFDAPSRAVAVRLLGDLSLAPQLWPGANWSEAQWSALARRVAALGSDARYEAVMSLLLAGRELREVEHVCRLLKCSNEQRETIAWLVRHVETLDEPQAVPLSTLKRLLASRDFAQLRAVAVSGYAQSPGAMERVRTLDERIAAIAPERVAPPPLVTGDDLIARGVAAGPRFKQVLDALYEEQLSERVDTRDAALRILDELLRAS